jgi:hypothetical protein
LKKSCPLHNIPDTKTVRIPFIQGVCGPFAVAAMANYSRSVPDTDTKNETVENDIFSTVSSKEILTN